MRPKTMIAVLAAGGILGGAFAARGLADERRPGRHRAGFGALADYLGLSADQRQQLASLREEHRK
ncbi:MAG TPA: hypothetical protein VIC87_16890, partial [Vicinamibacteria bacterium]